MSSKIKKEEGTMDFLYDSVMACSLDRVPNCKHSRTRRLPMPKFDMSSAEIIFKDVEVDGYFINAAAPPPYNGQNKSGNSIPVAYGDGLITSEIVRRIGVDSVQMKDAEQFKAAFKLENSLEYKRKSTIIFKKDNKITMTKFDYSILKKVGKPYTEKHRYNISLTLNVESGCFYFTRVNTVGNGQKSRTTKKNDFFHIGSRVTSTFKEEHIYEFLRYLIEEFQLKGRIDDTSFLNLNERVSDVLIEWFIKANKLKTTDNFKRMFVDYYPGLTLMKKKKGNLTEAICAKYKFKGKKIRKLLNINDNVNIFKMKFLNSILEHHQINEINDDVLLKFCDAPKYKDINNGRKLFAANKGNTTYEKIFNDYEKQRGILLSVSEQNKIIKLMEENLNVGDMIDHISMRKEIEVSTGEEVKMSFRNKREFDKEHQLFSKVLNEIKRPASKIIYYPDETIELIEESFIYNEIDFSVHLLQDRSEYINEGAYQNHCVGGYSEYLSSNIISIRRNNETVRLTCEFNAQYHCVQKRLRSNYNPDEEWLGAFQIIADRVRLLFARGLIKSKELRTLEEDKNARIERSKKMLKEAEVKQNLIPNGQIDLPVVRVENPLRQDEAPFDLDWADIEDHALPF